MGSENKAIRRQNPLQRLLHRPRCNRRLLRRDQIRPRRFPLPSSRHRLRSNPSRTYRETTQFLQNGPDSVNVLLRTNLYPHEHGSESLVRSPRYVHERYLESRSREPCCECNGCVFTERFTCSFSKSSPYPPDVAASNEPSRLAKHPLWS